VKDIEKYLIENDPPKGSQTDRNTQNSDEAQSDNFETTEPEKDNPARRELEIGQLGQQVLKEVAKFNVTTLYQRQHFI
jgi:hypothetical protein